MTITTVDIGTNTVLALDTVSAGNHLQSTSDSMDITRLGEGLDRNGRLSEAAMARTLTVLERIGRSIQSRNPDRVAAVATEAVRSAANGAEFLERARHALGHPVSVIDGEREAGLSWLATSRSLPPAPGGRRTVVDIGGGSTELTIGRVGGEDTIERAVSVPIGSVRLTERLLHTDPPGEDEKRALVETIDRGLDTAPRPEGDLVGIAGTVTTLCAIHLALASYDPDRIHGQRMTRAEVDAIVERLGRMRADERHRLPGLDPKRADVIYAGGVILARVLARSPAGALIVSDRGVRWGLAYEIAEQELGGRCH